MVIFIAQHCATVDLPDISGKGQIVDEKATYELGETVTFQCSSGYSPSGASSATCGEKGFDVDVFYCVPSQFVIVYYNRKLVLFISNCCFLIV